MVDTSHATSKRFPNTMHEIDHQDFEIHKASMILYYIHKNVYNNAIALKKR